MNLHIIKIKDALNKAYLKLPPTRSQIDDFKGNISYLLRHVKDSEGEEFHKNEISEFLKKTYYSPNYYINTRGRYDLVIHNGKDNASSVGIIIEAKSPGNISEMPTVDNLNVKSIHELILYYFRERISNKNLDLKHLITTNLYEWFIFDAHEFEKHFANNKSLVQKFIDFEEGRTSGKDTSFFYNSVVSAFLDSLDSEIKFTHLDLRDFERIVINSNQEDDICLIPLYKIFSPEHLLKLQFKNDSNSLDKDFYRELLHIIGLEETKQGSKKLIGRASEKTRNYGSLLESAISILKTEDLISQVPKQSAFGETLDEQLFNISLELVITWINRILFLKLLEGQLVKYNRNDKNFTFLNQTIIPSYDSLNKLFFHVLAIPENERDERLKERFKNIPYLNSSLFESTDLERKSIRISNLDDENKLPIYKSTALRDNLGKRISGERATLAYLLEFLDAYNFSSEGVKGIQEENKTLINSSVLGLIFEKINGYKDGSFFTPGFITQYMCHETITRAVVQKFNETKGWNCETLTDVHNKIEDHQEANSIINSLRICDPAVGSGHFLVSALNEIISIKSELKILTDRNGRVLRDYSFEVTNDELIVSDPDGEPFEYHPKNKESHRVQEAIFHEKQAIIENCLFGVDINPNSVKICRLRLWIELLKHAYYKLDSHSSTLETLPNIDINIKCGNSLISRYSLDANIKSALKSSKWTVDSYREAVMNYRNASSKEEKRTLENLISKIKNDFATEVSRTNQDVKALNKYKNELLQLTSIQLFDYGERQKKDWHKRLEILNSNIDKLELKISEIKNNAIYKNAFEWRFEFPEVLNDTGDFIGFDVIIGNPPYVFGGNEGIPDDVKQFFKQYFKTGSGKINLFTIFIEIAFNLLKNKGQFSFIIPNTFLRVTSYHESRKLLIENHKIWSIYDFGNSVFEDAITTSIVLIAQKGKVNGSHNILIINNGIEKQFEQSLIADSNFLIITNSDLPKRNLIDKLKKGSIPLGTICKEMIFGVVITKNKAEVVSNNKQEGWKPFLEGKDIGAYYIKPIHSYLHYEPKLLHRARTPEVFEVPEKLLVQRITGGSNPLKVAYDTNKRYNKESINNIILKDDCLLNAKYILALLNSKLINWFYANQFTNDSLLTVNLSKKYLSQLPIIFPSKHVEQNIVSIVDQILITKQLDFKNNTCSFESAIDHLIYELYELTNEEIQVVESS